MPNYVLIFKLIIAFFLACFAMLMCALDSLHALVYNRRRGNRGQGGARRV